MSVYGGWPAFTEFAAGVSAGTIPLNEADLGCPEQTTDGMVTGIASM
jgi:hypothetical protein